MCVYVWHWIIHFYGWGHPWCQDKRKRARLNLRPVIFLGDTMDYTLGLNHCYDRKKSSTGFGFKIGKVHIRYV